MYARSVAQRRLCATSRAYHYQRVRRFVTVTTLVTPSVIVVGLPLKVGANHRCPRGAGGSVGSETVHFDLVGMPVIVTDPGIG